MRNHLVRRSPVRQFSRRRFTLFIYLFIIPPTHRNHWMAPALLICNGRAPCRVENCRDDKSGREFLSRGGVLVLCSKPRLSIHDARQPSIPPSSLLCCPLNPSYFLFGSFRVILFALSCPSIFVSIFVLFSPGRENDSKIPSLSDALPVPPCIVE